MLNKLPHINNGYLGMSSRILPQVPLSKTRSIDEVAQLFTCSLGDTTVCPEKCAHPSVSHTEHHEVL